MEEQDRDLNRMLAGRVRRLRSARGLTLDELADRSGVSRSMISLVERGESNPTAVVLDRISSGLGVTLASLFEPERNTVSPVARRSEQPLWRDPQTGYVRRNLSPPGFHSPIELVEVDFPAGGRITYETGVREVGIDQQVWVLEGEIDVVLGDECHRLLAGDCFAMRLDRPITYHNSTDSPARYLVVLTTEDRGRARR
ncbi:helix-turn-helix domain-containing protein [Arenibaculum pallidiluteum]|uniref:helix-turn-helix domain-containing protein n=1 Tax=Arenibaculum pallidiluteum TaxID=2812559 RepID=UPI001A95AD70|nr:XRE family transcriptional regulator [Arenibaculum pallidiluteum]